MHSSASELQSTTEGRDKKRSMILCYHKDRYLLLDILAALFGISSWVSINGLWTQLPLMVDRLPESWDLASYLSITVQLANIGPLAYGIARSWCTKKSHQGWIEKASIYSLLAIGTAAGFLLSRFWSATKMVGGSEHSLALLVLVFFLSLVDCTSSVLYFPYMAQFRETYLISFMIGEGFSGLIPAIGSLAQGVGGNPYCKNVTTFNETDGTWSYNMTKVIPEPRFSVDTFFYFLGGMVLVSGVAFFLMDNLPSIKQEHASNYLSIIGGHSRKSSYTEESNNNDKSAVDSSEEREFQSRRNLYTMLGIQSVICFLMNGAMPSIQPYSCLPYGNTVFHLSVTLHSLSAPVMAFAAFFIPCKSERTIKGLFAASMIFVAFIFATAFNSPDRLAGQQMGGFLTVAAWVSYGSLLSYVKVSIASKCRQISKSALYWYGVFNQIGSAAGALVMFFLTTNQIFHKFELQC